MTGPPVVKTQHFALHMADVSVAPPSGALFPRHDTWLGVLIPKRWAKHAVTRNALRRQIYAVAAELAPQLPPNALVVRLRTAFSRQLFPSARSDALKRAARTELLDLLGPRLQARRPRPDRTTPDQKANPHA